MAIQDDFSVAVNGDIRYTGSGTTYTVLALHRWLQDIADNASVASDDLLSITESNPSDRATDNIFTLLNGYNIDDRTAEYLYDGSITQDNGNTFYRGLVVVGSLQTGTELQIIQNNVVLKNFWGTGLNADANQNILLRIMVKTRSGGTTIDGERIRVQAREMTDSFAEFSVTLGAGNSVAAVSTLNDLNNQTSNSTIAGWTDVVNTEGYRSIDVDGNSTPENYYSEWDKGTRTINQVYERTKWLQKRALIEDSNADTGTDYTLRSGATTRIAQAFAVGGNAVRAVRVRCRLKKTGAPTGNLTATLYALTGSFGSTATPNGAAIATSENIDVSKLTTSYAVQEIRFTTLASQALLSATTNYFVAFEYSGGDVSNNVQVEGDSTGTHAGNAASFNGSWSALAAEDLWFQVYTSSNVYGIPGELFRGITHEINVDTPTGTFSAVEGVSWSGGTGQMLAINSTTAATKMWIQLLTGVVPTDNQMITGATSGATVLVNITVTSRPLSPSGAFLGQSTGTALIGAYGIGVQAADLTASDLLTDLTNTTRQPPNNVQGTVTGLVVGEDYVLVGWDDTGDFDKNQLTLNTSLTGATETAVVVSTAIPSDTPASGTIRVQLNNGTYRRVAYTSWTGSTFTISSTDFSGANNASAPKNVFITYIDKLAAATSESFTVVFSTPRTLRARVRDGGGTPIKPFEATFTLGSAGGSVGAIRTTDT